MFCQLPGMARSRAMASALRRSTSSGVLRCPGRYRATRSGSAEPLVRGRGDAAGGVVSEAAAAVVGAAAAEDVGEGAGVVVVGISGIVEHT